MSPRKDTLWEQFLQPVVRSLMNEEKLQKFYDSIDWEAEAKRFRSPDVVYPEYYKTQNFHGVEGGYLNPGASVSYDPVTQYVLPPNETWIREGAVNTIQGQPRRILDLGCGTGSTTLMLKQAFPQAEVTGLDLSPYMLFMSDYKAKQKGLNIHFLHGRAEATGLPDASFDVVTASLLFHETPPEISKAILQEAFRLLVPGGQVVILDGHQKVLREMEWLNNIFEEPYILGYAEGNVDAWMGSAGFETVRTDNLWWIHQVSYGMKPLPVNERLVAKQQQSVHNPLEEDVDGFPAPAF